MQNSMTFPRPWKNTFFPDRGNPELHKQKSHFPVTESVFTRENATTNTTNSMGNANYQHAPERERELIVMVKPQHDCVVFVDTVVYSHIPFSCSFDWAGEPTDLMKQVWRYLNLRFGEFLALAYYGQERLVHIFLS